ncbi:MAG: OmpA family protein [Prevotella sp.]|nr:OmpA family protein [Prevotella sp.]
MKKILALLALASVSMGSFAQDVVPEEKYSIATNSFFSNWFVQAGLDWNAWYSAEERGHDLSKSPFKKFRSNPGISLAFGKWFTPGIGLRTKIQGFWGKKVDADWNEDTNEGNGNKYWVANEQVMFNLTNLFKGYKEERVWNMMAFAGAGVGRSMTHNNYAMNYSLGLHSAWKVAEKVQLFAEAGLNTFDHNIDNCAGSASQSWIRRCKNYYFELGVTYNLGSSRWRKAPDMDIVDTLHQSELDALNAALEDANAETERLRGLLEKKKAGEKESEHATDVAPEDSGDAPADSVDTPAGSVEQ